MNHTEPAVLTLGRGPELTWGQMVGGSNPSIRASDCSRAPSRGSPCSAMDAEDARGAGGRDGSDDRALWRPAADPTWSRATTWRHRRA